MATKKQNEEKAQSNAEVASEVRTDPRGQTQGDTQQPQMLTSSGEALALAGDQKAKVNPDLDTLSVSIPTGQDENGIMQFDNFEAGEEYDVSADALKIKNTEQVALLVAVEEGGE